MGNDYEQIDSKLKEASDYIVSLEDKCYESNKKGLDLLHRIAELELELEDFRAYMSRLTIELPVYIPVKND